MMTRLHWPKHITEMAIVGAVERRMTTLDNPGFCLACGADVDGVEPDARNLECEECGEYEVYSAEELLLETV